MKKLLGIVVLGLLYFSTANSNEIDTSKFMYDACKVARSDKEKSTDELFDAYMCKFYFKGAWEHAITRDAQFKVKMESMNIKTDLDTFLMLGACVPVKTSLDQFIDIFINHMERNPQKKNDYTMITISDSAKELFPCKK